MLEKTLESPLDCKEIQPVHPKGNQSWIFIGRTDAEAESPILWPPHVKNWLIGKDPDAGKDWRQEDKGTTEDETVRWDHQLDGHEFEQALGVSGGQGNLVCCSPRGCKETDTTEQLNWTFFSESEPWVNRLKVACGQFTWLRVLGRLCVCSCYLYSRAFLPHSVLLLSFSFTNSLLFAVVW